MWIALFKVRKNKNKIKNKNKNSNNTDINKIILMIAIIRTPKIILITTVLNTWLMFLPIINWEETQLISLGQKQP